MFIFRIVTHPLGMVMAFHKPVRQPENLASLCSYLYVYMDGSSQDYS